MRYQDISTTTPPYNIIQCLSRKPEKKEFWPNGFYDWANVQQAYREAMIDFATQPLTGPNKLQGAAALICGGGIYVAGSFIVCRVLQHLGWPYPIQLAYLGDRDEIDDFHRELFESMGVELWDTSAVPEWQELRLTKDKTAGWLLKPFALKHTPYRYVIALDSDCYPIRNPKYLLASSQFEETGALFWPDISEQDIRSEIWKRIGVEDDKRWSFESGQIVLDTEEYWKELSLAVWLNDHSEYYYTICGGGDKETFAIAMRYFKKKYHMPQHRLVIIGGAVFVQYDFAGVPVFIHRTRDKFSIADGKVSQKNYYVNTDQQGGMVKLYHAELPLERECHQWLEEYRKMIEDHACTT